MKSIFTRKKVAFFTTLFIIGFFIGYDYTLITASRPSKPTAVRIEDKAEIYERANGLGEVTDR